MIVGGRLRGINRASRQALTFCWAYTLYGIPVALVAGFLFGESEHIGIYVIALIYQFVALLSMLPAAVLVNFVALRLLGWRSWRHERWRARVAGILAIPVVWIGTALIWFKGRDGPPELLRSAVGGWAAPIFFLACVVTFSNFSLLAAWLLPPRKRWAIPPRDS